METKQVILSGIKENEANPRQIKGDKFSKLVNSILSFPQMLHIRPIVVDDTGTILGGNMRYRALLSISQMNENELRERIAKAVKGKKNAAKLQERWLSFLDKPSAPVLYASELSDEEKQRFIIEDNVGFGEWDWDRLANEWDSKSLEDWGLDVWQDTEQGQQDGGAAPESNGEKYTAKIESPHYEPRGEKPNLEETYDLTRYNELIAEIERSDVPENEKMFLRFAATRHISFNYEMIADYYAHSDTETQKLFESSCLVIIYFDDAIKKGFVKINDGLIKQQQEDWGDDEE